MHHATGFMCRSRFCSITSLLQQIIKVKKILQITMTNFFVKIKDLNELVED